MTKFKVGEEIEKIVKQETQYLIGKRMSEKKLREELSKVYIIVARRCEEIGIKHPSKYGNISMSVVPANDELVVKAPICFYW